MLQYIYFVLETILFHVAPEESFGSLDSFSFSSWSQ